MQNKKHFLASIAVAVLMLSARADAASLTGKAMFEGTPPAPQVIKADADPKCKMMHPDGLADDSVVVNSNGTLKNVFVYVKSGAAIDGKTFETPKDAVKFDQNGCHYSPKVFGIMVNQPLEIINSDDTLHNVHALSKNSKEFNLGMPIKGMKLKKTFTKPEVMVKIKCEVHPWMGAYAGVVAHPYYAVTGDDGSYTIKDLPAGEYEIEAWHEKYGSSTQKVTVADVAPETNFQFKG
jgi:hypothetical protein